MGLLNTGLEERSRSNGVLFEHFIINQVRTLNQYKRLDWKLSYLRTKDQAEVDLIIERPGQETLVVEIKSADLVDPIEVRKMARLAKDVPQSQSYFLSKDPRSPIIEGVHCLHWKDFFDEFFG